MLKGYGNKIKQQQCEEGFESSDDSEAKAREKVEKLSEN